MRIKSQIYSEFAFEQVSTVAETCKDDENTKTARSYKSLCKRAGGIFRTVGLIQFVTFIEAKGKKETHYKKLMEQLREELNKLEIVNSDNTTTCLAAIRKLSLPQYMQATQVVLQLLMWHRRMAEILIEGEDDDQTGKGD